MLTDATLHVLHTLAQWRFLMVPGSFLGSFLLFCVHLGTRQTGRPLVFGILLIPLGIVFGIGNFIVGPQISAALIHGFGARGQATITGSFDTGNSYNDHKVMGHKVLIRTADARTIETSFEDDDFNVYPAENGIYYPGEGDMFNVSYIERFPQDFIISSNDDSPWARSLRRYELKSALRQADNERQFAPDSSAFRKAYEDAAQAVRAAGCDAAENE